MKDQDTTIAAGNLETLQSRFALRVAARLTEGTRELPRDTAERLRAAREQALQRARLALKAQPATGFQPVGFGATAALASLGGNPRPSWWLKFASALPLAALVGGFLLIQHVRVESQISAAADIDSALLADDVPPAAYSDPGFVEFLKAPRDQ